MRRSLLFLFVAAFLIPSTVAYGRGVSTTSSASQSRALYQQSLSRVRAVTRLQLNESVTMVKPQAAVIHNGFRYVAPDRMAVAYETQPRNGQAAALESIQVGKTKCQRPPTWVCFPAVRVNLETMVRSLLTPHLGGLRYSSQKRTQRIDGRTQAVTMISIRGSKGDLAYRAVMTVSKGTTLPLAFDAIVTQGEKQAIHANITFRYGGTYGITLPHGKGVHLPH